MAKDCCDTTKKNKPKKIPPVEKTVHEHKEGEVYDHADEHDEDDGHNHGGEDSSN